MADAELDHVDASIEAGTVGPTAVYHTDNDARAVGKALRWARSRNCTDVELLVTGDELAGALARRAALLPEAAIAVSAVTGAEARPAEPAPASAAPALLPGHRAIAGLITEAGATPVDDHGVLVAEFAGLEIARVIDGDDGPVLDVGVGQADRELNQMVHAGADPVTDLRRVIAAVADYRLRQRHHPLGRLSRERWLRAVLIDDPSVVGAADLRPAVPLRPRGGLRESVPSAAVGTTADGGPLVVVTMVGVDLDVVPEAADYRAHNDPEAEVVVVMPERDLTLSTTAIELLPRSRAVSVEGPWIAADTDR
ncbi:MAG: hypothetical protein AAGD35_05955 [Actinomycetota bacterium]